MPIRDGRSREGADGRPVCSHGLRRDAGLPGSSLASIDEKYTDPGSGYLDIVRFCILDADRGCVLSGGNARQEPPLVNRTVRVLGGSSEEELWREKVIACGTVDEKRIAGTGTGGSGRVLIDEGDMEDGIAVGRHLEIERD